MGYLYLKNLVFTKYGTRRGRVKKYTTNSLIIRLMVYRILQ